MELNVHLSVGEPKQNISPKNKPLIKTKQCKNMKLLVQVKPLDNEECLLKHPKTKWFLKHLKCFFFGSYYPLQTRSLYIQA